MSALLSPPNLLTLARVVLTPFIVAALTADRCVAAFWMSLAAGSTDAADGYLARWMGQESTVGAYLDPVADKLLLTSLFLCFGISGLAPWWLVWLVLGRDLMILSFAAGGFFWKGIRDFAPSLSGKLSTLLQILAALGILSQCAFAAAPDVVNALLYLTALATAWSGIEYFRRAIKLLHSVSR